MPHTIYGYDENDEVRIRVTVDKLEQGVIKFDDDDPEGIGCYMLTREEATRLSQGKMALPNNLTYFVEYET